MILIIMITIIMMIIIIMIIIIIIIIIIIASLIKNHATCLKDESFCTFMRDVEAIVNS